MPLILSGWIDCCTTRDSRGTARRRFATAFLGTLGFGLLFPMLVIRGSAKATKMQMARAWAGAFFGTAGPTGLHALGVVFWAFASSPSAGSSG